MPATLSDLRGRLPELMLRDEHRLRRRINAAGKLTRPQARRAATEEIAAAVAAAERRVAERRAAVPAIGYPGELPVSKRRDEIAEAIANHQVVVVAGETGSGKTTQLPKICLQLGRGVRGRIGHTQPRRLAARTVAERIAEELHTPLGHTVGYQVRFTDTTTEATPVKLMTDGILLTELSRDRMLRQYDTLIIDEAHERSLNIDFILGYLKQLLPRRPDLKLIITSATIDPQRFARHFAESGEPAPIVEVSGRTYPVQVRYRPLLVESEQGDAAYLDQTQGISDAVDELSAGGPGDILVFLSGEREIRDTADVLRRQNRPNTEVLPLYSRLSTAEQHRVFAPHTGRRIVLATNVAETSLTVPGIRYVIDPGTARISRYSNRTKVQRLPIEPISQASANQRAGRCGRVAEGICIRLYSEEDFNARPEFTEPEILRTNLASVILRMIDLGLGDIAAFPFVEPPETRHVRDGMALLHELGALDTAPGTGATAKLTAVGRRLAQLPIDPRMGRMIVEGEHHGCLREVMVLAAALSIQDPRERPADSQQAADSRHARFADERSDFLAYLNLWRYLRTQQRQRSSNQFRRMCRDEFLNYRRVREWQDLYAQLHEGVRSLGMTVSSATGKDGEVDYATLHQSLLAGLLSHIGRKDADAFEYQGARGARFAIFPGSSLFKRPPRWVVAAELVETSRLWARAVARIEPEWLESLAPHLVRRSYSEPHWSARRAAAMAYEKVTLYGLPIVTARRVTYAPIDPEVSRELFVRHALVEGQWQTRHAFFHANRRLLAEVQDLEERARRRDILVDDQALFDFYDRRIPADVVSGRHFDRWWKQARRQQPHLLDLTTEALTNPGAQVSAGQYPDTWTAGGQEFGLSYAFEPGRDTDGVTVRVPLDTLNQLGAGAFDWQVPGLREELVTALIRSLPKPLRRQLVPAPDHARAVLSRVRVGDEPLLPALERELAALRGVTIRRDDWDLDKVPAHLRTRYEIVDADGTPVAGGRDLAALQRELRPLVRRTIAAQAGALERGGLREWPGGALPREYSQQRDGHTVKGYPALVDEGDTVAVRVFGSRAEQAAAMWAGTRKLLLMNVPSPVRAVQRALSSTAKLVLSANPHGRMDALLGDCTDAAADALITEAGGPAWDEAGFTALVEQVRPKLTPAVLDIVEHVQRVLAAAGEVERALGAIRSPGVHGSVADVREQLGELVYPGFVTATGAGWLPQLPRYLQAMVRRLEKLPREPGRDAERMAVMTRVRQAFQQARPGLTPLRRAEVRWMIEELRVSLFAQQLGTVYPISEKRILRALDQPVNP